MHVFTQVLYLRTALGCEAADFKRLCTFYKCAHLSEHSRAVGTFFSEFCCKQELRERVGSH